MSGSETELFSKSYGCSCALGQETLPFNRTIQCSLPSDTRLPVDTVPSGMSLTVDTATPDTSLPVDTATPDTSLPVDTVLFHDFISCS